MKKHLTTTEQAVMDCIIARGRVTAEDIRADTGYSIREVSGLIQRLKNSGEIKRCGWSSQTKSRYWRCA